MTTRETDTSEFDGAITSAASEALFDRLVEENVLTVEEGGGVRTTDAFDDTHAVYHDSYVGVSDADYHEAVAATFGLEDAESAAELIEARGVERREFICYLAVRSHLDGDATADGPTGEVSTDSPTDELSSDDLAAMAGMVSEVVPDSPVPPGVADVTDDPERLLAGRDRAVVSVWKRFCDPCDALKADLDAILDAIPDDVAVAGIDGEVAIGFCGTHGVESAPGFVLFRDGERVRTVTGSDPDEVVAAIQTVYSN
jgi:thiol-disulfide isomerase/thioredoxin